MSDYMKEQHESTLAQHGRTGMNRASSFQGPFDNRTQGRAQGSCYNVMPYPAWRIYQEKVWIM